MSSLFIDELSWDWGVERKGRSKGWQLISAWGFLPESERQSVERRLRAFGHPAAECASLGSCAETGKKTVLPSPGNYSANSGSPLDSWDLFPVKGRDQGEG